MTATPGASAARDSTLAAVPGGVWAFLDDLFGLSTDDLHDRALRIAVAVAIVAVARLVVLVVGVVSGVAVRSSWGPLRFLFRNRQRSITIQNLLISLTKYVVYFTALGYILSELGIDYRAYLASLSLIGIAVGFGSQGLVQDVVTGFFILFENQFAVGDMVEISGQVGVVEAIGLRTTRVRNYLGAVVVLQNRNIPMAVRYPEGGLQAVVDVAVGSEDAPRAGAVAGVVAAELQRQFGEVILAAPRLEGLVELATGERFVRLRATIWPAQQWVVDGQLLPRLRETFAREGLPIPGDRIVAFYHFPSRPAAERGLVDALRQFADGGPI